MNPTLRAFLAAVGLLLCVAGYIALLVLIVTHPPHPHP
jgi:hypothetical protein